MASPLHPHKLKFAESEELHYKIVVDQGVEPEDVLDPEFWRHVARKLPPHTRLTIWAWDTSWVLEAYVIYSTDTDARVVPAEAGLTKFTRAASKDEWEADKKHKIVYINPQTRWAVQRKVKGKPNEIETLKDGFASRAAAEEYLRQHKVALGSAA